MQILVIMSIRDDENYLVSNIFGFKVLIMNEIPTDPCCLQRCVNADADGELTKSDYAYGGTTDAM